MAGRFPSAVENLPVQAVSSPCMPGGTICPSLDPPGLPEYTLANPHMILRPMLLPAVVVKATLLMSCYPGALQHPTNSGYLAGIGVSNTAPNGPQNPAEASKFWDGDSLSGPATIHIVRSEQKAYFYKGDQMAGVTPVSTGSSKYTTPPGTFKVSQKAADYASRTYGTIVDIATGTVLNDDADSRKDKPGPGQQFVGAPMPHFLRFNHGIGMHAGHLPGYAASHGCVRLPADMARKFFEHAEVGTPVIVE